MVVGPRAEALEAVLVAGGLRAEVHHAVDVPAYRAALAHFRPHLVICERVSAHIDGIDALEMARGVYPDLPVIVVSSVPGVPAAVAAMRAGATDYIDDDALDSLSEAAGRALASAPPPAPRHTSEALGYLAEHTDLVFWMTDTALNQVVTISPAYERIWGRTCASLIAEPGSWTEVIHPDDRDRVVAAFRRDGFAGTYDAHYRIHRPDGEVRWIHDRAFPVLADAGRRIVGISEDVTERHLLALRLQRAQRVEAIGQLASGLAHDFNNVLMSMMGYADLVHEMLPLTHPGREYVAHILDAGERAADLLRRILVFARRPDHSGEPVELNALVTNVIEMVRPLLGDRIHVTTHLADGLPAVDAPEAKVQQILVNLAINARQSLGAGGNLELRTEAAEHEGKPFVVVIVADDGVVPEGGAPPPRGIDDDGFDDGADLGQLSVDGIVRQVAGTVVTHSAPGQGTTVRVVLPAAAAGAVPDQGKDVGGTETILVVEDEDVLRRLIASALRAAGYTAIEAGDGDEAVALGSGTQPLHLLIADVMLPGRQGPKVAEAVRAAHPGLPVIYMSGNPASLPRGADVVLPKPFFRTDLLAAVRTALDLVR